MFKYGQYCPVAQALELIGDRWTLLIIRDMLTGTQHFNDLERGLPGISRALLAKRLRHLTAVGIVEKQINEAGRNTTTYHLTESGYALFDVVSALTVWGADWAFNDPSPEQLNPLLLLWWMHNRVCSDNLPNQRIVIQFDFYGATNVTYWLVLTQQDVTICQTDPGYDINLIVTADIATIFKVWLGRLEYGEALLSNLLQVEGIPQFVRSFPDWFAWSPAADAIRAARQVREAS